MALKGTHNTIDNFVLENQHYAKNTPKSPKIDNFVLENQHYENTPMQQTDIFLALKIENFQLNVFDIFRF